MSSRVRSPTLAKDDLARTWLGALGADLLFSAPQSVRNIQIRAAFAAWAQERLAC